MRWLRLLGRLRATSLLWPGFIFTLLLSGCGGNETAGRRCKSDPLTSIQIVADYSTIAAHTSTTLKVTGDFSGHYSRDITDQVVWSSSSPQVAGFVTASSPNRVSGLTPGTADLIATVGSVSNTYTLTVSSATITSITVTPATPSVPKGLTIQLLATGTFSDATTQDITFDAGWASSDPAAATVSDAVSNKGLIQALAVGSATIRATLDSVPGSTLLTVTAVELQSISVTPADATVFGFSVNVSMKATGTYSDGTTADITGMVTWNSSLQSVATITTTGGTATTVAAGTTSISAALDGINGNTNLTVKPLSSMLRVSLPSDS
ncbi:Ig-like domain-containing protein [Holophaga foetida]|uniref:Ig-like domain-containing protein n=1 Tax=Holophaga foetida TaxID=35839 RepID=UPI000247335A|nr:Ig-like domain-containing protein [Holophaga foetida]